MQKQVIAALSSADDSYTKLNLNLLSYNPNIT